MDYEINKLFLLNQKKICKKKKICYNNFCSCGRGGIGRRARFRF